MRRFVWASGGNDFYKGSSRFCVQTEEEIRRDFEDNYGEEEVTSNYVQYTASYKSPIEDILNYMIDDYDGGYIGEWEEIK